MPVTIGALREGSPQETRVSVVPEVAEKFGQTGARILLEHGAGTRAQFPDSAYKNVVWADSPEAVLEQSDVVLTVQDRQRVITGVEVLDECGTLRGAGDAWVVLDLVQLVDRGLW